MAIKVGVVCRGWFPDPCVSPAAATPQVRPPLDYRTHSPMPGQAPGHRTDKQTISGQLVLDSPCPGPQPQGHRDSTVTSAWLVRPWRVLFAHPGASGARRVAETSPEGPVSTLLPAPPIVNPTALSKDTSEAVKLS